jgi:hypothetical protein
MHLLPIDHAYAPNVGALKDIWLSIVIIPSIIVNVSIRKSNYSILETLFVINSASAEAPKNRKVRWKGIYTA